MSNDADRTKTGAFFVRLIAANENAFNETIRFYTKCLGFSILKNSRSEINHDEDQQGCWLRFCSSQGPLAELSLLIQLNLTSDTNYHKMSSDQKDKSLASLTCFVDCIQDIVTLFQRYSYPFKSPSSVLLECKDPLGTNIIVAQQPASLLSPINLATSVSSPSPSPLTPNPTTHDISTYLHNTNSMKIAILTSGGDAPGMNAALRSIARFSLLHHIQPYVVIDGYKGLLKNNIHPIQWDEVSGIMSEGGTRIGTARCLEFRKREGRKEAVLNLTKQGIGKLVVIGGDGSLTGADLLREEWGDLLGELEKEGAVTKNEADVVRHLTIVGLVGSIDNDMAQTNLTIGAITSLHRICESVSSISSTATSHNRAFVIEVMGRHCGWLAVMSAISVGADFLFIPEHPVPANWQEEICAKIKQSRKMGKRKNVIIVAEGALDADLKPIKAEMIKNVVQEMTGVDTRVTTLGHVQRGGAPAFFDRYLATVQGVEAVRALLESTPESDSPMIGISENKVTVQPLMKAVELTKQVEQFIQRKDFEGEMALRDPEFRDAYQAFISTIGDHAEKIAPENALRIAIVHVGAPAGGMNTATRVAVRLMLNRGHCPLLVNSGFAGLMAGDIHEASWMEVEAWAVTGGSELGTNRTTPSENFGLCAYQMQKHNIQALLIVGGFEAFTALKQLEKARESYPNFCVPMILIPATISNNVPGTEFSLGTDTALNAIIEACDRIKQSAHSSRKRVFVVEVQGGQCGFLATMAGLTCGATCAYVPEEGINLAQLAKDCSHLTRRFSGGEKQGRIIIRNECASQTYTTDVISSILREEGHGVFDARSAILGHIQQGGDASPLDRVRATRLAVKCIRWIELQANKAHSQSCDDSISEPIQQTSNHLHDLSERFIQPYTPSPSSACVIGIRGTSIVVTPVSQLHKETDAKHRRSREAWWRPLHGLIRKLAKYEYLEPGEKLE